MPHGHRLVGASSCVAYSDGDAVAVRKDGREALAPLWHRGTGYLAPFSLSRCSRLCFPEGPFGSTLSAADEIVQVRDAATAAGLPVSAFVRRFVMSRSSVHKRVAITSANATVGPSINLTDLVGTNL